MTSLISPKSIIIQGFERVYYGCCGLPYGKEDQTLLIDDELKKGFWNSK